MDWTTFLLGLAAGLIAGFALSSLLKAYKEKTAGEIARELLIESEQQKKAAIDEIINNLKLNFSSVSLEALSKSTEEFLKLAKSKLDQEREATVRELDSKKALIDQQLVTMNSGLENVARLLTDLEKDRIEKFQELSSQLQKTGEQTSELTRITGSLREALASSKVRGQWGERMADDVLRMCGFVEDINYTKQSTLEGGSRPDFTFILPRGLKLNMDVKFPLDNYLKWIEAANDMERKGYRDIFLRNIRDKIKEVSTRSYIDPAGNTVDYVLLFIPNEHIYAFIHDQDASILEDALKSKVIFCSPITLFAVLAVIRQAVDNFALERTSHEILGHFGVFREQWGKFIEQLEKVGKRLADAQKEYDILANTRRKQLERPLTKIEQLKSGTAISGDQKELYVIPGDKDNTSEE
jgi:DNA recombination protein RmuC